MSTLERAIVIAAQAHEGQVDKAGAPYILHPLRVMMRLSTSEARIVGVLHDVVEDTKVSIESLRDEGFSEVILEAILAVTKRLGESYQAFVIRAAENPLGRQVKLADLADNCDLNRITNPTPEDFTRIEKYRKAIEAIQAADH